MTHLKVWELKYKAERPRRLLALDGGGILGVMSLEILAQIERQLKEATGAGEEFRLGDYFDYIGGTSTGAIIATGLSRPPANGRWNGLFAWDEGCGGKHAGKIDAHG